MPTRTIAPLGAPCWTDLWTSDVEHSRHFYSELFGWEAQAPSPEFGGYFMFTRQGVPVAGGQGPMGNLTPSNTWKVFLNTDDIAKALESVTAEGGQVVAPAMPVAELGIQAVVLDPTGAELGIWQPGTFPGFTVLDEPGSPGWFELFTRDHGAAVAFYRSVFRWDTNVVGDTDEFRYSTLRDSQSAAELAGVMDARAVLPDGVPAHWTVYWNVDDVDVALRQVVALGGTVIAPAHDTPYGRVATASDGTGAQFELRTPNP